jgi:hypothetical protein
MDHNGRLIVRLPDGSWDFGDGVALQRHISALPRVRR